jgi:hypothetical protein
MQARCPARWTRSAGECSDPRRRGCSTDAGGSAFHPHPGATDDETDPSYIFLSGDVRDALRNLLGSLAEHNVNEEEVA